MGPHTNRTLSRGDCVIGLLLMAFAFFISCIFLVVHISHTRTGELHSHLLQSPMVYNAYIWQIATWCPKGIVKLLSPPQCMQPSAWWLSPWLPWTRSLFAVLGHYPSLPRTARVGFWRGWIICNIYIKLVWPPEDVWNVSETCRVDVEIVAFDD
jgi:hypothetical protein